MYLPYTYIPVEASRDFRDIVEYASDLAFMHFSSSNHFIVILISGQRLSERRLAV